MRPVIASCLLSGWLTVLASAQINPAEIANDVSFAAPITLASPVLYPQSIAATDINHDGIGDLAIVGEESPGVCTTTNWQSGNWDCSGIAGDAPVQIIFADVNRDGNQDVVATDADLPVVTIGYGNGKGQFHSGAVLRTHSGYATEQAVVTDLNGDGVSDVIATTLGPGNDFGDVSIFLGQGHGQFAAARNIGSSGVEPLSVAVGDLNHDGIPDLVFTNFGVPEQGNNGNIVVRLGRAGGTFSKPIIYAGLHDPRQVLLADFNHDGNIDLAVLASGTNEIWVALGKGDGTFSPLRGFPAGYGPIWIATADFNGDGITDLVISNVATPNQCYVSVLLGNGDGTFEKARHFPVGVSPWEVVVADFNGDGRPDIATINGGDSTISILLNTTPWPKAKYWETRGQTGAVHRFFCCFGEAEKTGYVPSVPEF